MDRRRFLMTSLGAAFAAPFAVGAQPASKVHRIGYLDLARASDGKSDLEAFTQRMRDLGYVEDRNISFDHRWAEGNRDRLPGLAAELVELKVDAIVTITTPAAQAAKAATATIPIVMAGAFEPVKLGLIASLARPGANVTGMTNSTGPEHVGKQFQFIKEAAPRVSRVAWLWNPMIEPETLGFRFAQDAVRTLGQTLISVEVTRPDTFDVDALTRSRPDALVITPNGVNWAHRHTILELATRNRLATMCGAKEWVVAGALMSYWADWLDLRRRAAAFVDKILKGAKPADLPVEQPTKFELVINMKTAKALGLTIPPSLLLRADQVIE